MKDFSKRLRAERERLGMNRNEMAKELKISHVTLSQNELGNSEPSERTIKRVVEKFGWNDGAYADYYYGISDVDARRVVRQVKNKMEELDATQKDVAQVLGIWVRTFRVWMRKITPKNKRALLEFVAMDEETYRERLRDYNNQYMKRFDEEKINEIDNPLSKEDLKKHRLQRGYTLAKLADKINVDPSTVGKWERGVKPIPAARIRQLYRLFGLVYYEPKRVFKTQAQREKEKLARVTIMHRMDRKVDSWTELDDNDPDLLELRELVGAK